MVKAGLLTDDEYLLVRALHKVCFAGILFEKLIIFELLHKQAVAENLLLVYRFLVVELAYLVGGANERYRRSNYKYCSHNTQECQDEPPGILLYGFEEFFDSFSELCGELHIREVYGIRIYLWLCIEMFQRGFCLAYSTSTGIISSATLHSGWR